MVRNLPAMWETQVWSLGWEDPLEMATHSSILAWRIPWTWGPSGLQSVGLQRGRHNWATNPEGKGTVPLPEAKRNYYLLQVTHTMCLMPLHLYDNHIIIYIIHICCCCSVTKSYLTLCDPLDYKGSLSLTIFWSFPKIMSIESVMSSNHLILCCPLLLLPSIFPSIRVFFNELALHIRWPKFQSLVVPMNIQGWFPLKLTDLISLLSKGLSRIFSSTTVQKHQFFSALPSLWSSSHMHTWLLERPQPWLYDFC